MWAEPAMRATAAAKPRLEIVFEMARAFHCPKSACRMPHRHVKVLFTKLARLGRIKQELTRRTRAGSENFATLC